MCKKIKNAVTLGTIQQAAQRIGPSIRRTPTVAATHTRLPLPSPCSLFLKLENQQVTGSFKIRGVVNKLLQMGRARFKNGIVAASGGNHGRAVAFAGLERAVPTFIYLPLSTPDQKVKMIKDLGATVILVGEDIGKTIHAATTHAEKDDLVYIHPFADPDIINGAGTLALEIFEDLGQVDVLVAPVGGGGIISGMGVVAKALNPNVRVYGVEPEGCPTLYNSLKEGKILPVSPIKTTLGPLAMKETQSLNFSIIQETVDQVILLKDEAFQETARWLWQEMSIPGELSGVASLAGILRGKIPLTPSDRVCAVISGAGPDGLPRD